MATRFNDVYGFAQRSRWRLHDQSQTTLQFLRRLRNPAMIGAVAPSGRALAELIVSEILPGRGPVLEAGAGTGVFTAALLERGVKAEALTLIEADPVFAAMLRKRFPGVEVISGRVEHVLSHGASAHPRFADAISGLPLLNFPRHTRRRILACIFDHLVDDGALYQFTYGPKSPIESASLAELGLVAEAIGHVWRNLPPATVYRIHRRGQRRTVLHN